MMEFQTNLKKLRTEEGLTQDQLTLLVETSTDTIGRIERKQKIASYRKALNDLIKEHDLPPVVFHSLRHTSVTYKHIFSLIRNLST